MTSRLNPYVTFAGSAKDAMAFYQSVFGGQLDISTFGEFGGGNGVNPDGVMHAQLTTDSGYTLMASDLPPGMDVTAGNNITIALSGDDGDALRGYFSSLADGGSITTPLEKQMWGDEYGALTDRFGINWLVNIGTA